MPIDSLLHIVLCTAIPQTTTHLTISPTTVSINTETLHIRKIEMDDSGVLNYHLHNGNTLQFDHSVGWAAYRRKDRTTQYYYRQGEQTCLPQQ